MRLSNQILILMATLILLATQSGWSQSSTPFNQRDDKYRLLGLKRAHEAFQVARSEYDRQQELFDRQLITRVDLERAHNIYADAEVNYQQSLLAVLFEEQYVTVSGAVKYQADDGRKHVRLTLANTSGGSAEFRKLVDVEDDLFRSLQPDIINNIYVSMVNDDGAVISQPYETKIDELRFGEPQTLDFAMLQDLDVVTVYLIYSNGTERNMKIILQKDATVDKVAVQSEQFSQEVELGKSASFDLSLELFSGSQSTYRLEVVNLPRQVTRFFKTPGGQVRLSQIKFTESASSKRASLQVDLPDRPSDEVTMDEPIVFYVLVYPREDSERFSDAKTKQWTEDEIAELGIGYVRLEVLPRGRGELRVRAPLLFHSIVAGESIEMGVDIFNEGSNRIDNIEMKADIPLGWTKVIEPSIVPSLEISQETKMNLSFVPPNDVPEGRYEIRLRTSGMSGGRAVDGEDKTVTIEIRSETSIMGATLIVLLLFGTVGGIVIFGVRLSRR